MKQHEPSDGRDLAEIILLFRVAMMTTVSSDGRLRSRPMMSQRIPFDGVLWFFLSADPEDADHRKDEGAVNVSYSLPQSEQYLSVSGQARLVFDRQKIDELWNSDVEPWFPEGPQDPHLALLRVQVESWEYWDSSLSAVTRAHLATRHSGGKVIKQDDDRKRGDLTSAWVHQDVGTPQMRKDAEILSDAGTLSEDA